MPCGRYRRDQFSSQSEYEAHRTKLMKLILGEGWEDKPLAELVAEHPELQRMSLPELLHEAHHVEHHQLAQGSHHPEHAQSATTRSVEIISVIGQRLGPEQEQGEPNAESVTLRQPQQGDGPLAIEGKRPQTAEEWLRQYIRTDVPEN